MKRVHLLPNIITAFGLSCGLFVIFKVTMLPLGGADYLTMKAVAGIMLLAAFADLLDGAIARAMRAQSEFGGLFDSLADAITFGVGPSVIILKSAEIAPKSEMFFFLTTSAMIFSVCGVLRLVRFNLAEIALKKAKDPFSAGKQHFTGLPIPAAAAAIVSLNLLLISPEFNRWIVFGEEMRVSISLVSLILLGYLMISRWRFPSLKTLRVRVASFQVVFLTALTAVFIFYGILYHFAIVFFLASWFYVLTGLTLSITRFVTGKRAASLADFEPASDDIK